VWDYHCHLRGWLTGGEAEAVGVMAAVDEARMLLAVDKTHAAHAAQTAHAERRRSTCGRATSFARYFSLAKRRVFAWGIGEHGQVGTLGSLFTCFTGTKVRMLTQLRQLGLLDKTGREVARCALACELLSLRAAAVVRAACGDAHSVW
jgi:hypothetical protein